MNLKEFFLLQIMGFYKVHIINREKGRRVFFEYLQYVWSLYTLSNLIPTINFMKQELLFPFNG